MFAMTAEHLKNVPAEKSEYSGWQTNKGWGEGSKEWESILFTLC